MATRPDRFPAYAADPALSLSQRAEPGGATGGANEGDKVAHEHWNWIFWELGGWARYLDEAGIHNADFRDPGTGYAYRVSATAAGPQVTGGLSQTLATGGAYLVDGARLAVFPDAVGPLTYPAAATFYLHIRSADPTERRPCADVLVSTLAVEAGYVQIGAGTTDATTVTAYAESSGGPGPVEVYLPELVATQKTGWLDITQDAAAWGGPSALTVSFADSVLTTAGVVIAAQAGATQRGLEIRPDVAGSTALFLVSAGAAGPSLLDARTSGVGAGIGALFGHQDGGTGAYFSSASGGGGSTGRAVTIDADDDAAGLVAQASATAQAPIRIVPQAFTPATQTNGDIHIFAGDGAESFQHREGGKNWRHYAAQDGPNVVQVLNTGTLLVGPGVGPSTLATTSYFFRNGAKYAIRFETDHGRDAGGNTLCTYAASVNGTALPGLSGQVFDFPTGAAFTGNMQGTFSAQRIYTHGLADGNYMILFTATASAGGGDLRFENRAIHVNAWS